MGKLNGILLPGDLPEFGNYPFLVGLECWLPINEKAGSRLNNFIDSLNPGLMTGGAWVGNGVNLDGTDDIIVLNRIAGLVDWTVLIEYTPTTTSAGVRPILDQGDLLLCQSGTSLVYGFVDENGMAEVVDTATSIFTAGTPVSIGVTKSGSVHTLYIDGIQRDTFTDATAASTQESGLVLGRRASLIYAELNGTAHRFDGGNVLNAGTGDLAVSSWIKMDGNPAANSLIAQKYGSGVGYSVYIDTSGRLTGYIQDAGGTVSTADGASICDNVWHHVAIVFDRSGDMVRYVDGAAYGTDADISARTLTITNSADFVIGSNSAGSNLFFGGSLRDFRVLIAGTWSSAQVAIQAANPVDNSLGGSNTSSWYFTDGAADTDITDDTASNDLALAGGTTTDYSTHTRVRNFADGKIESLFLWSRVLASEEIQQYSESEVG